VWGTYEIKVIEGRLYIIMTELRSASKYGGESSKKIVHDPNLLNFAENKLFINKTELIRQPE
jgi:hypothetical protein